MTKRFTILVGCLFLALLTNLSFRTPDSAQAQAPACETKICFREACDWCNVINPFPRSSKTYEVFIPNFNAGNPIVIPPFTTVPILVRQALGCEGFVRRGVYPDLIAEYVAAQLSIQDQVSFYWVRYRRELLGCHVVVPMAMPGMPAPTPSLPVTLSNGTTLTRTSTLYDLFQATEWAAVRGTAADQAALLAVYKQLDRCRKD